QPRGSPGEAEFWIRHMNRGLARKVSGSKDHTTGAACKHVLVILFLGVTEVAGAGIFEICNRFQNDPAVTVKFATYKVRYFLNCLFHVSPRRYSATACAVRSP